MDTPTQVQGGEAEEVEVRAELLLVDNDLRIVELLALFLRQAGYGVRTAASFTEARAALLHRRPDLMLSDLDLGVESGRAELPALAAEGLLPPTLVVSGYLDAELEQELMGLPDVLGTLPKPFDFPQLLGRVKDLLDLRTAQELASGGQVDPGAPLPGVVDEAGAAPGECAREDDSWLEVVSMEPQALRGEGALRAPAAPAPGLAGPGGVDSDREDLP